MELEPIAQSSSQNENFLNASKKWLKNKIFSRIVLFHLKSKVCLKHVAMIVSKKSFFHLTRTRSLQI